MMIFLGAISLKKNQHACAGENGNEFGVSLELTPNSKKNMRAQGFFERKYACTRVV